MKKNTKVPLFVAILFMASIFTSCMTTKTNVGAYREKQGSVYTYAKGKQFWLFWGFIPLGRTSVNTPGDGDCQVVTRYNFGDVLISGLTGGLVSAYTIKVKAKRVDATSQGASNTNNNETSGGTKASNESNPNSVNASSEFKIGDKVAFKNFFGSIIEGKVIGVNSATAIIEFTNAVGKLTKKEIASEKLTKVN
ncbi:hypothetical protein KJ766_00310 [Patescibacteria group bacterium]|nr:hypothetical protein [Patescibacteria group bacterium]